MTAGCVLHEGEGERAGDALGNVEQLRTPILQRIASGCDTPEDVIAEIEWQR